MPTPWVSLPSLISTPCSDPSLRTYDQICSCRSHWHGGHLMSHTTAGETHGNAIPVLQARASTSSSTTWARTRWSCGRWSPAAAGSTPSTSTSWCVSRHWLPALCSGWPLRHERRVVITALKTRLGGRTDLCTTDRSRNDDANSAGWCDAGLLLRRVAGRQLGRLLAVRQQRRLAAVPLRAAECAQGGRPAL